MSDFTQNQDLILSIRSGDRMAMPSIYKLYYGKLCTFALSYVHSHDESEEIVQETMVWLWENRKTLIPELNLKSLLFTIVKNKCLNSISYQQMRNRVHTILQEVTEANSTDINFYFADELDALYEKAVMELPEEFRQSFIMNRIEMMTYSEIAASLGVSKQTVAYRISQCLRLLRIALADYLPEKK